MEHEFDDTKMLADYTKGFNQGYLIAQEKPELIEGLAKAFEDNDIGEGFRAGCKQYLLEKLSEKQTSPTKDKLERSKDDKDKNEPDRD